MDVRDVLPNFVGHVPNLENTDTTIRSILLATADEFIIYQEWCGFEIDGNDPDLLEGDVHRLECATISIPDNWSPTEISDPEVDEAIPRGSEVQRFSFYGKMVSDNSVLFAFVPMVLNAVDDMCGTATNSAASHWTCRLYPSFSELYQTYLREDRLVPPLANSTFFTVESSGEALPQTVGGQFLSCEHSLLCHVALMNKRLRYLNESIHGCEVALDDSDAMPALESVSELFRDSLSFLEDEVDRNEAELSCAEDARGDTHSSGRMSKVSKLRKNVTASRSALSRLREKCERAKASVRKDAVALSHLISCRSQVYKEIAVALERIQDVERRYRQFLEAYITEEHDDTCEQLQLSRCQLNSTIANHAVQSVPVSRRKCVRCMDFSNNQIEKLQLPASFEWSRLQVLDLSYNFIADISDWNLHLLNLRVLSLHHNRLSHLPDAVMEMQSLSVLDIAYNRFVSLPAELMERSDEMELRLVGNPLLQIPYIFCDSAPMLQGFCGDCREYGDIPFRLMNFIVTGSVSDASEDMLRALFMTASPPLQTIQSEVIASGLIKNNLKTGPAKELWKLLNGDGCKFQLTSFPTWKMVQYSMTTQQFAVVLLWNMKSGVDEDLLVPVLKSFAAKSSRTRVSVLLYGLDANRQHRKKDIQDRFILSEIVHMQQCLHRAIALVENIPTVVTDFQPVLRSRIVVDAVVVFDSDSGEMVSCEAIENSTAVRMVRARSSELVARMLWQSTVNTLYVDVRSEDGDVLRDRLFSGVRNPTRGGVPKSGRQSSKRSRSHRTPTIHYVGERVPGIHARFFELLDDWKRANASRHVISLSQVENVGLGANIGYAALLRRALAFASSYGSLCYGSNLLSSFDLRVCHIHTLLSHLIESSVIVPREWHAQEPECSLHPDVYLLQDHGYLSRPFCDAIWGSVAPTVLATGMQHGVLVLVPESYRHLTDGDLGEHEADGYIVPVLLPEAWVYVSPPRECNMCYKTIRFNTLTDGFVSRMFCCMLKPRPPHSDEELIVGDAEDGVPSIWNVIHMTKYEGLLSICERIDYMSLGTVVDSNADNAETSLDLSCADCRIEFHGRVRCFVHDSVIEISCAEPFFASFDGYCSAVVEYVMRRAYPGLRVWEDHVQISTT